jgi:hypothetical protein
MHSRSCLTAEAMDMRTILDAPSFDDSRVLTLCRDVAMQFVRSDKTSAPILLGFDLTISDSLIERCAAQAEYARNFRNLEPKLRKGFGRCVHESLCMRQCELMADCVQISTAS